MDNRKFFVAFFYSSGAVTGHGNTTLISDGPITDDDDIRKIEAFIKENYGYANVVLMSWQRMETP